MIENLTQLVRDNAIEAIINNPSIPNEHNNAAIEQISITIIESLKCQIIGGGLKEVLGLFENKAQLKGHVVLYDLNNCVINDLISKFGISHAAASDVAAKIISPVIEKLIKKTNDPADSSFEVKGILSVVGGNAVKRDRTSIFMSALAKKLATT